MATLVGYENSSLREFESEPLLKFNKKICVKNLAEILGPMTHGDPGWFHLERLVNKTDAKMYLACIESVKSCRYLLRKTFVLRLLKFLSPSASHF
jgi:hypothetical protein